MSDTIGNLLASFAGESQANRKYTAFAEKAEAEGLPQVAKLFRAAAAGEAIHAAGHLKTAGGVGTTLENLRAAAAGEHHEVIEMYPPYIEQAISEGNRQAQRAFENAFGTEKCHEEHYLRAIAAVEGGGDLEAEDYWLCSVCGYLHAGAEPPEKCPVCGVKKEKFVASN